MAAATGKSEKVTVEKELLDMEEHELHSMFEQERDKGTSLEDIVRRIASEAVLRERDRLRGLGVDATESGTEVLTEKELMDDPTMTSDGWTPTTSWRPEVHEHIKQTRRRIERRVVTAERARAALRGGQRVQELAKALADFNEKYSTAE